MEGSASSVVLDSLIFSCFLAGNSVPQDICCLAADERLVFAAYGNVFSAFARNKEVCIVELLTLALSSR